MKRIHLTDAGRAVPRALNEARLSALQELMSTLRRRGGRRRWQSALELILASRDEIAAYRPTREWSQAVMTERIRHCR